MITITEDKTTKMPGDTSLYISFDYDKNIVDCVKCSSEVYNYNKNNHIWELPITSLSYLIRNLPKSQGIEIILQKEKKVNKRTKKIKSSFKTKPYKYQLEGIEYGLNHDKWLLLDVPGLGKTLQTIYLAQELKERGEIDHCLIICGVNTLKNNWKNEIKIHSDLSCKILGERKNKKGELKVGSVKERVEDLKKPIDEFFLITNIETLRSDDIINALTKKPVNKFDMIVLDECHACKSVQAIQSKNLLKLKAKHMLGLTGTIITNSPLDCYVPLKWIGEDRSTFTNYKYYYCNYGGPFNNELLGYRHINVLKNQLERCTLRRTEDLLDLPEKTVINEYVDMDSAQQVLYTNIKNGIVEQVDKVHISTASIFSMISRLRQATACPSFLTTEDIPSAKADRAVELTEQILSNGNKVVIFSVFKETLNSIQSALNDMKIKSLLCTGDVKDEEINKSIKLFQEDKDYKVMLATTAKMGTGITLTAANYAIFVDCPWTAALCEQCEKRIHRIGSKKPVFIYYLWTNDTVDLKVKEIVDTKEIISDWIVDSECPPALVNKLKQIIEDL